MANIRINNILWAVAAALASAFCGCHPALNPNAHSAHYGSDLEGPFLIVPESGGVVPTSHGFPNPSTFAATNPDLFWDSLVDVVGDYFRIKVEQRVQQIGNSLIEGRIEVYPRSGATYLEPWRRDSVGSYERTHATLQSIRRTAFVRVIPNGHGFVVDVQVLKELEDVPRPEHAVASVSTFQFNQSVQAETSPLVGTPPTLGWIPLGRDAALEQQILARLHRKLNPTSF
jgi:hypothetical protein